MWHILYGSYFLVLFLFTANALSRLLLVGKRPIRERLHHFTANIIAAIVWPVFLFSRAGWQELRRMWNEF